MSPVHGWSKLLRVAAAALVACILIGVGYRLLRHQGAGDLREFGHEISFPEKLEPHVVDQSGESETATRVTDSDPRVVEYEVVFPDGDIVEVHMREAQALEVDYGVEDLATSYNDLVALAEKGDAIAAMKLGRALRNCHNLAFDDEHALQGAIDSLLQTYAYISPRGVKHVYSGSGPGVEVDTSVHEAMLRRMHKSCKGISGEVRADFERWVTRAAELGNLEAILDRANSLRPGLEKLEAWQMAWRQGEPTALGWVAEAYSGAWPGVEVDPVQSYAYSLAYFYLMEITLSDRFGHRHPSFNREGQWTVLEERRGPLDSDQQWIALGIAKRLLSEGSCCVGLWRAENLVGIQREPGS